MICLLAILLAMAAATQPPTEVGREDTALSELLARLDGLADLYRDNALRFSCNETITYEPAGGPGRKVYELEYIYVYEKDEGLSDYRTRRGVHLKKGEAPQPVDLVTYGLPTFVQRAYSWVFIFERAKREMYKYRILGEEKVGGRMAAIVAFEPVPPFQTDLNDWFGSAWVDRETYQLLKVDAVKADQHLERMRFEVDLEAGSEIEDPARARIITRISTEFSVQRSGMTFPESVIIHRSRYKAREEKKKMVLVEWPVARITQSYANYRFFGVRTRDEIRAIVSDTAPPGRGPF